MVLLKSVRRCGDSAELVDILIRDGQIAEIASEIHAPEAQVWQAPEGTWVSPGWLDLWAFCGEPGQEDAEDYASLRRAAARGGFTHVCLRPDTQPRRQTRADLRAAQEENAENLVQLLPHAALSFDGKGEAMNELFELHEAGAVAFTEGNAALTSPGLLLRSLQYLQRFDGLLVLRPKMPALENEGQMHEGIASTQLGMRGLPAYTEKLAVQQAIEILRYVGGKLHFSGISSQESLAVLAAAKTEGLQVSADMAAHQCSFLDEDLASFDTFLKADPPFRQKEDAEALKNALKNNTLQAIASHHMPCTPEQKNLEFDLADFGLLGIQTAYAAAQSALSSHLSPEEIAAKFYRGAREVLGLPVPKIEIGEAACLTLFAPEESWTFAPENNASRSANSPFLGKELRGKVLGVCNGEYVEFFN